MSPAEIEVSLPRARAAALVARDRYRPELGSPTTWLYEIASHQLTDGRRRGYAEDRARRRLGIERPPLSEEDVAEFSRLADEVAVVELLDELPSDQRDAVQARLVDDRDWRLDKRSAAVRRVSSRVTFGTVHHLKAGLGADGVPGRLQLGQVLEAAQRVGGRCRVVGRG